MKLFIKNLITHFFFLVINIVDCILCKFISCILFFRKLFKKRILIIRLDQTLGDFVNFLPFIYEFRNQNPDYKIDLLIHKNNKNFFDLKKYVDDVFYFSTFFNLKFSLFFRVIISFINLIPFIFRNYDKAIITRYDEDHFALPIALISGANQIYSLATDVTKRKKKLNSGFNLFISDIVHISKNIQPDFKRNLLFLKHKSRFESLNNYSQFFIDKKNIKKVNNIILGFSYGNSKLKDWGIENFIRLCNLIYDHNKSVNFVLIGSGPVDMNRSIKIQNNVPNCKSYIDILSKSEIINMISNSKYYIGNDSGLMHLSYFLGLKVISIFGPSCDHVFGHNENKIAVSIKNNNFTCRPCKTHSFDRCVSCIYDDNYCLKSISADKIYNTFLDISIE